MKSESITTSTTSKFEITDCVGNGVLNFPVTTNNQSVISNLLVVLVVMNLT
jgi:hypothetical protein